MCLTRARLRRACQCPNINARDAGMTQYARAFACGRPGCHDIVDKRDVGRQGRIIRHDERLAQVASPLFRVEIRLRCRRAPALQQIAPQRYAESTTQRSRQFQRLVVTAFAQPRCMQWNRYQNRGSRGAVTIETIDPELAEYAAGSELAAELEAGQQPVQWMLVNERNPRRGKRRFVFEAFTARRCRRFQRQGTTRAANPVMRQVGSAASAQIACIAATLTTQQAMRR